MTAHERFYTETLREWFQLAADALTPARPAAAVYRGALAALLAAERAVPAGDRVRAIRRAEADWTRETGLDPTTGAPARRGRF